MAAFLLTVHATMGLSAGVAQAEEPSVGGESPATPATTSQQSDAAEGDSAAAPDDATEVASEEPTTRDHEPEDPVPVEDESEPEPTADPDWGLDPSDTADPEVPQSAASSEAPPEADVAAPQPADPMRSAATTAAEPAGRPIRPVAEPEPAAAEVPVASELPSVRPPAHLTAATPIVEAPPSTTATSGAAAGTVPVIKPRLDRQLAGGISDVGTIVVSVVHAVATAVAQAFGPDSFLGVPYLLATMVANTAAAVGRTLVGAPLAGPAAGQYAVDYGLLNGLGFFNPTKPPPGANDPSTSVTGEHPLPIILLNSTVLTQGLNWHVGAPVLANAGYKVYTFNYGNTTSNPNFPLQSIGDIRKSAAELAAKIDEVLIETGAPQVILIGHSQGGGLLPSYYINNMGGAGKVSQLVGIGPGHHGTDFNGLVSLVLSLPVLRQLYIGISEAIAPAFYQQSVGSPFLDEVYGNGDTRPGVLYTNISTAYDEVATPYTRQALAGPNVTNIVLQQRYPGLLLGHLNMVTSPYTWHVVLEALAGNPAANPAQDRSLVAA